MRNKHGYIEPACSALSPRAGASQKELARPPGGLEDSARLFDRIAPDLRLRRGPHHGSRIFVSEKYRLSGGSRPRGTKPGSYQPHRRALATRPGPPGAAERFWLERVGQNGDSN